MGSSYSCQQLPCPKHSLRSSAPATSSVDCGNLLPFLSPNKYKITFVLIAAAKRCQLGVGQLGQGGRRWHATLGAGSGDLDLQLAACNLATLSRCELVPCQVHLQLAIVFATRPRTEPDQSSAAAVGAAAQKGEQPAFG